MKRAAGAIDNLAVPGFLRKIREYGHLDVNGCLNCGSCTVVCDLSSDFAPFPRRPIQYALLGLEQSLRGSLEPWLCHDCRDCSILCPKQAEPADSMATIRRYLAAQYDPTGLASRLFRSGAWQIGTFAVTALLMLAVAYGYHLYASGLSTAELLSTPMGLEHMFPKIIWLTRILFLFPLLVLSIGALRMHGMTMKGLRIPLRAYAAELGTIVVHMTTQRQMRKCPAERRQGRWLSHWLLGFAFSVMSVILFFFLKWFQTDAIVPLYNPQRWLGYLITAVMVVVPADILLGRLRRKEVIYRFSEREDVALPILLLLTAISGIAIHVLRYLGFGLASHFAYAIHLSICAPLLLIEVPFGKLSHVVYRPLAIYFRAVKRRALAESGVSAPGSPVPVEEQVA